MLQYEMQYEIFAYVINQTANKSKYIPRLNIIRLIKTEMEIQINPTSNNERKDFLRGREGKPPRDNLQR